MFKKFYSVVLAQSQINSDIVFFSCKGYFNPLNVIPTKWSNIFKQFVAKFATNCLSAFEHFVGLALKGLISSIIVSDLQSNDYFLLKYMKKRCW